VFNYYTPLDTQLDLPLDTLIVIPLVFRVKKCYNIMIIQNLNFMENILLNITNSFVEVIDSKIESVVKLAPYILGALGMFLFGWIFAILVSRMILAIGHRIKLEVVAEKIGLKRFLDKQKSKMSASALVARVTKGYLIFLFFIEATKIAQMHEVADFLSKIISYIPTVIIAIFIMLVGISIGNTLQTVIATSLNFAKSNTANVLGIAAKYTMVTFAVLAALSQLQIAEILIQTLFIGFISMLAIAGGLAIGLGGKDFVKELLEDIKKVEMKEKRR
jgi:hypothetical protein